MASGNANWQKAQRSKPVDSPEPSFDSDTGQSAEYRGHNNPDLRRVSELQFGDVYRMYEGPGMEEFVKPHQGWRTFVGLEVGDHPGQYKLHSTRLGQPSDFHYSDLLDRRFQVLPKEEAVEKDIAH